MLKTQHPKKGENEMLASLPPVPSQSQSQTLLKIAFVGVFGGSHITLNIICIPLSGFVNCT